MASEKSTPPENNGHQNNASGKAILTFATVFVVIFFIYLTYFHPHMSPDEVANLKKQVVATEAAPAPAAPAPGTPSGDPWVASPEKIARGDQLFQQTCALCHGAKGLGDGMGGASLNPKPRNLVEGKWKFGGTPFAIFNTVTKGSPGTGMAPWGHLPAEDRWALVHFVRSISQNAPPPTDAEIKAYKKANK